MGVYICGMEMPKSCSVCPLMVTVEYEEICSQTGEYVCQYDRADDCPLVPVPPHGDLIDYDFCMKNYELLHDDDGNPAYAVRMRDINNAPVIIPAEEGET